MSSYLSIHYIIHTTSARYLSELDVYVRHEFPAMSLADSITASSIRGSLRRALILILVGRSAVPASPLQS